MAAIGMPGLVGLLAAGYAVGAPSTERAPGDASSCISARRAMYCLAGLLDPRDGGPRGGLPPLGLRVRARGGQLLDRHAHLLQGHRDVVEPGGLAAPVGLPAVGCFSSAVLFLTRRRHREIVPWATAVLGVVAAFFLSLMVFVEEARPFATLASPPAEGAGLNPLLRHPAMMFHPPMLYSATSGSRSRSPSPSAR